MKVIDREDKNNTLNEEKPLKTINKNPQSFLETNTSQTKILPSHKLQDHAY